MKRPLVEAFLELRWNLATSTSQGPPADTIIAGRFYEKIIPSYPHYDTPSTLIPELMQVQTPRHRWRPRPETWPIIQLGPGIFSFHHVRDSYSEWHNFRDESQAVLEIFFQSIPRQDDFRPDSIGLRYIDAIPFDPQKDNIVEFLRNKLSLNISLKEDLLDGEVISLSPAIFNWQVAFRCSKPAGMVVLTFGLAEVSNVKSLIWESLFISNGSDMPTLPGSYREWADGAHDIVVRRLFKKMMLGLKEEYPDVHV